jgi:MFS family permease
MSPARRTAVLLFAVAWGSNHFVPLLLVYRERLALSPVDLAILFGVYAVGLVPGLLVGGPVSDRIGRREVVLPAACLALIGSAILSFGAAGYPVLLSGRFVVGVGSGAAFSAGTAWIQDLARSLPAGTGARQASIALSSGFGGGPLVTGAIAQWAADPMRLPYFVQGSFLAIAIAAVALFPTAGPRAEQPRDRTAGGQLRLPAGFLRLVVPIGPWVFAFPSIAFAVLPSIVKDELGRWSVAYAGVVTATTLFSGVFVQRVFKSRSTRATAVGAMCIGALGILAGFGAASLRRPVGVLAAAVLLGVGYGGTLLAGLRVVESMTTARDRGLATAVFYVLAYLGFAAPLLQAAVARRWGDAPGLLITGAAAALTAAVAAKTFSPGRGRVA